MKRSRSLTGLIAGILILFAIGAACNSGSSTKSEPTNAQAPARTDGGDPKAANTPPASADIAGDYTATGTNPGGGGAYDAALKVTPRGDVYQFSWVSGTHQYDGVGVKTDNAVAVSFTDGGDGKGCGVVLYKIGADGSLDGKAGYWGVNDSESETATRTSGSDLEGNYSVKGKSPEGKDYTGTLAIKKAGEGYTVEWKVGSTFSGFGVRNGKFLAVGFGGKQCSFVSYEVTSDGSLDGRWGSSGSTSFGTELAKKK